MHPLNNKDGTVVDQDFQNGSAPSAQNMTSVPMTMPRNNQYQVVPNVMFEIHDENLQQQKSNDQQTANAAALKQQLVATYHSNVMHFDIEDERLRRQFVFNVLIVLLVQKLITVPVVLISITYELSPMDHTTSASLALLGSLIFTAMYIFSDYRRNRPANYVALIYTTIFESAQAVIHGTRRGPSTVITGQLSLAVLFYLIVLFSKLIRFKFTNICCVILAIIMCLIIMVIRATTDIIQNFSLDAYEVSIAFIAIYTIYDIQLQLTGHHGYNLQAEEHIFGACNVYVDLPNFWWRFFRFLVINQIIRIWKFFKHCCLSEVF